METPKRLEPLKETARRLYLTSGNQCAYPNCVEMIINEEGTLLGDICHIEAANPKGARFNQNQTNEQRRSFDNLMLMCKKHHKIIDDKEEKYTVKELKKMKEDHEKKFADAVAKLESSIEDITEKQPITHCKTLNRMCDVLKWGTNSDEELEEMVNLINREADKLKKLVPATRKLFSIMIKRSQKNSFSIAEVQKAAALSDKEFKEHYDILVDYHLIDECEKIDDYRYISTLSNLDDWEMWSYIKEFCELGNNKVTIEAIINDLNFSLLD
ncbi:hypothetical protein [Bacillus paralicheniformis]|uniref:hypothetical protein n=1 Tax=Bacillus paralicheniformis TaxID=1648923 RepID=UPI0021D21CCA|nr:hypothetical protein [Bacillus paralicheniformis]MCU4668593.1 hypothetical protein [Bacillus paralicheniformis]